MERPGGNYLKELNLGECNALMFAATNPTVTTKTYEILLAGGEVNKVNKFGLNVLKKYIEC